MIIQSEKDIKMKQAVQYCLDYPTLSMHHVAIKFGVIDSELQHEYRKEWYYSHKKGEI